MFGTATLSGPPSEGTMKTYLARTPSFLLRCVSVWVSLLLLFSLPGYGQLADDVHIAPRNQPKGVESVAASLPSGPSPGLEGVSRPLHMDVDLVLVPVTVVDSLNHPVMSLTKKDFSLYEGNKPQDIRYFSEEEAPISVAILFDVSKSMSDKIGTERAALDEFFNSANPNDEYFAITFSDRPRVLASATQSVEEIQQKLTAVEPGGPTAMLDAVYLAVSEMRSARYKRKAIVIFSDGGDNVSRYSLKEIKSLVQESDVQIYAIGLFETFFLNTFEELMGKKWLGEITDSTGGRTITVDDRTKVPEAAATISRELRNEYVLGYRPAAAGNTAIWRKIKVRVSASLNPQPVHAYYKQGYYAAH